MAKSKKKKKATKAVAEKKEAKVKEEKEEQKLWFGNASLSVHKLKDYGECRNLPHCKRTGIECDGKDHCEDYVSIQPFIPEADENYVVNMDIAESLAYALGEGENILLAGPPGCGKTTLPELIAHLCNWECVQYSASEETRLSYIIGQWVVAGDKMRWSDGVFTDAIRNGKIVIENESDFMRPELRGALHGIMDEGGVLTLQTIHPETHEPFTEVIHKHPNFRIISTANTVGLGDDAHIFHGTQQQNAASRDRYSVIVKMDYHKPYLEAKILKGKTGIDEETAEKMSSVAWGIRDLARDENSDITFQFSVRRLLSWAKWHQRKQYPQEAIQLAILNFMADEGEIESVINIIRLNFGEKFVKHLNSKKPFDPNNITTDFNDDDEF